MVFRIKMQCSFYNAVTTTTSYRDCWRGTDWKNVKNSGAIDQEVSVQTHDWLTLEINSYLLFVDNVPGLCAMER